MEVNILVVEVVVVVVVVVVVGVLLLLLVVVVVVPSRGFRAQHIAQGYMARARSTEGGQQSVT